MAKRELKTWHYQVTTALAVVVLICVLAFFVQTFRTFFLTDQDPVLLAVERIKGKLDERQGGPEADQTAPASDQGTPASDQSAPPSDKAAPESDKAQ